VLPRAENQVAHLASVALQQAVRVGQVGAAPETDVHLVPSRKQRRDVPLVGVMKAHAVPADVELWPADGAG
jgi:hypothetical protein